MTFEEWWENNGRDITSDAAINSDINRENDKERIVAVTAWEAAQSEIKKQLEFEKAQTESQRSMKILARNQRDAVTRKNNVLMNALEMAMTANEDAVKKELGIKWQPIETAPVYEMVLVLWGDEYICSATLESNYGEMVWYEHGDAVLGCDPTHWMPMLPPPDNTKPAEFKHADMMLASLKISGAKARKAVGGRK